MNYLRRHMYWQSKRLHWEGVPRPRAAGERTQENCSATRLTVSGIMVMGLVPRLSLISHCDSGPSLVVRASPSQDGFQRGCRELGGTYGLASPLSLWPFLNYSSCRHFVISVFLTRTSFCKITHASGSSHAWPGLVVSVSGFPNNV